MASVPNTRRPPGFEELKRSEFSRLFGLAITMRLWVAPVIAVFVFWLGFEESVGWRWVVMGLLPISIVSLSVTEVRRFRRRGMSQQAIELNLALAVVGQLAMAFATGGLESPVMPLMLVIALFWALLSGGNPLADWAVRVAHFVAPWAYAAVAVTGALPDFNLRLFGGGARSGHGEALLVCAALALNVGQVLATALGLRVRATFDGVLARALEANEALRSEYAERAQSQVKLVGEIGHELKNPLASVKGLATLLTQNVDERGRERLSVLRGEVDRMSTILEEFLTYSRPLLPLSVERADLGRLCHEVVDLHEGLARGKGVTLDCAGTAEVRCDERKVRQILVNLVQNAIDASPSRAQVEVRCAKPDGERATVEVSDRGAGLDPAVRDRLFTPGVTSKPTGNGIGLTVSRTLARQHGGEVVLEDRPGGGCVARLTLPTEPKERAP